MAGRGKQAGAPEFDHLLQTVEQAGQGGEDEHVQGRHNPGLGGVIVGLGTDGGGKVGDVLGQRRGG